MSKNIYTLVLNLFISENRLHRQRIALRIAELLDIDAADETAIQAVLKSHFMSSLMTFVDKPTLKGKTVLFELTKFLKAHFAEKRIEMQMAA